jgi:predicted methyltransferase
MSYGEVARQRQARTEQGAAGLKETGTPGNDATGPLLTLKVHDALRAAVRDAESFVVCSMDLDRTTTTVAVDRAGWRWQGERFEWLQRCKPRTIYYRQAGSFEPVARFGESLVKLVPTHWGPPTFEIDGIKMLPSARVSPYSDAERKVRLIQPRGKVILDTCGGLGYFAAWCLQGKAKQVLSYEKNPDVFWLRTVNPWSPVAGGPLSLNAGDVVDEITRLASNSVDAILHDPPRFGTAGELYSQAFYEQLARVIKRKGRMFHYTGTPNKLTSGRDVPKEVAKRLRLAGFVTELHEDGVLAVRS